MKEHGINWRMEPVQKENRVRMYIYDDISEYGEWDWNAWEYKDSETSGKYFAEKLEEIPDGTTIELHINSDGGSVKEGTTIFNLLKQKSSPKIGIVDGVAHSVAFLVLQACDTRKMCHGTTALVHNMWVTCSGNATQLRKYADDLDDMMQSNRQIFLERATISEEELIDLMEKETYLTPDKALEYGLIDEIMQDGGGNGEKQGQDDAQQKLTELRQQMTELRQQMTEQQSFREQLAQLKKNADAAGKAGDEPPKEKNLYRLFGGRK